MTFKDRYIEARDDLMRKRELKALMKSKPTAEWVIMRVNGQGELERFTARGWELAAPIPLGAGAGIVSYQMKRLRDDLEDSLTNVPG